MNEGKKEESLSYCEPTKAQRRFKKKCLKESIDERGL